MAQRNASASSQASTLLQPVRRFDLLISEHQTLVKTAQESVQQALETLESASSEDEQRAAKLQVQSLLQRVDELVLTLRLATEVRKELAYVYEDISETKKDLKVERIQWLEQQMGKLILTRRRGRPAAKGRRSMVPQNPERGLVERGHYEGGTVAAIRATPQPSVAASSRLSVASKPGNGKNCGSVHSSRVSPSRDSDIWHSESEANWTNADARSGVVGIDESESSIPVEGKNGTPVPTSVMSIEPLSTLENQLMIMPSMEVGLSHKMKKADTFELARPVLLFGTCSWNSLPLALANHFVTPSTDALGGVDNLSPLRAELEGVMVELRSLRERVLSAAQASATPMTTAHNGKKSNHGSSSHGSKAVKPSEGEQESTLPPIEDLQKCPLKQLERKTIVYPRPATVWQVQEMPSRSKHSLPKIRDNKTSTQRIINKRAKSCNEALASDSFGCDEHNQRHIEYHLRRLSSTLCEERKDAAQVLGHTATETTKSSITESLKALFLSDNELDVKYEVMKSLITLGCLDEHLTEFMALCLKEGSQELKIDLLKFAAGSETFRTQECCTKCARLQQCLHGHLQDSHPDVSVHAALLLSSMQFGRDSCVGVLKAALHSSDCTHQAKALSCLVNTWHYWDKNVLMSALNQLHTHFDWRQRLSVATDLRTIGICLLDEVKEAEVFEVLHQRLCEEPIEAVRCEIGQLMTDLNMNERAQTVLLGWLEHGNEFKRADAIVALGAFGARTPKLLHSLLDCLELDPSIYVRVQVVRLLGRVKHNSHLVVNRLLEISKGSGLVARESQLALQKIACQFR